MGETIERERNVTKYPLAGATNCDGDWAWRDAVKGRNDERERHDDKATWHNESERQRENERSLSDSSDALSMQRKEALALKRGEMETWIERLGKPILNTE